MLFLDYSGCLGCRSTLTGGWNGARSQLVESGITFDGNISQFYQGVTSGGLRRQFEYGGHNDYVVTLDMGKLMGAEGMFVKLRGESQFGEFVNNDTGSLLATNSAGLFPTPGEQKTVLTNISVTQMLSQSMARTSRRSDATSASLSTSTSLSPQQPS
jgi:porin